MDCDSFCDFTSRYACSALPEVKALERDVLGCDYGGTSWTTNDHVQHIISSLALDSSSRLLEVGSGSGWPGLYLSTETGCNVTLVDMPLLALEHAQERAAIDDIVERVSVVNGSGAALPFADASFDRLSHSDVLCCLPEKLEMLKECRRVATDDARMHFIVIEPATGLSSAEHERVLEAGPPFVDVPEGYKDLLRESGWNLEEHIDVTDQYGDTLGKEIAGLKKHAAALEEAYGADELCAMSDRRENAMNHAYANVLQRFIYVVSA